MSQTPAKPDSPPQQDPFELALEFVLAREGGYSNDPRDPGGETNFGISKRAYPDEDIRGMTRERAAVIYRRDYWDVVRAGELPPAIGLALFDAAVNHGPRTAIVFLQQTVHTLEDGVIGPITIAAVFRMERRGRLASVVREYLKRRLMRYVRITQSDVFFGGWADRVLLLQEQCVKLILGVK